jgi:hypothetical protein
MTARTSPTWDNNPNHKPDPMKLYAFDSPILSLHHSGAYSIPPVDANVIADVNLPVDQVLNLKAKKVDNNPNRNPDPMTSRTSPKWDKNPNHKPDPMNLHHTGAYSLPQVNTNV